MDTAEQIVLSSIANYLKLQHFDNPNFFASIERQKFPRSSSGQDRDVNEFKDREI